LELADDVRFPPRTITRAEKDGKVLPPFTIPSGLLVIRGHLAYEFTFAESGQRPCVAHYRLTGIRTPSYEAITFTYGPNGVDY
jgi:hypothetical protein